MTLGAVVCSSLPLLAQGTATTQDAETRCGRLIALNLAHTTVTSARLQQTAAWTLAIGSATLAPVNPSAPVTQLPTLCRVALTLAPSNDSHIEGEVWLPLQNWNGKFQEVGNGGWAGAIPYPAMGYALQDGYATAATDTGHKGANALFAIGHPEKLVDLGERSVHEMAVTAKAIIEAFYGRASRLSYWNGCSTGGRQGLMAAQKYPNDFDGIVAGAPAYNWTQMEFWNMTAGVPVLRDPAGKIPAELLALINRAAVQACDARDGVVDGIIGDPRACTFDPASLQCHGSASASCLTAPQVESVERMYSPVKDRAGRIRFPGKERGSEPGWRLYLDNDQPYLLGVPVGTFHLAHNDPAWDLKMFDAERDVALAEQKIAPVLDATNPDLRAFKAHGGKLLLYHGWADPLIAPQNTINYYSSVLKAMPGNQDDFIRLFMMPGVNHCFGGPGPNQANWVGAEDRWREASIPPSRIDAVHVTNNRVDMTRPLCPYPQIATYSGKGSTNDAANFSCKAP
jgi:feruloyl esterase